MLRIREFQIKDMEQVKRIHEKFYKKEFKLPDFYNQFLFAFTIEEDSGDIVTVGGIRTIAESVILTDQDVSVNKRVRALRQVLNISSYISKNFNYPQLHAFIQDENWENILIKSGFNPCKGKALYYNIGEN